MTINPTNTTSVAADNHHACRKQAAMNVPSAPSNPSVQNTQKSSPRPTNQKMKPSMMIATLEPMTSNTPGAPVTPVKGTP